jgi:hypothetical protein
MTHEGSVVQTLEVVRRAVFRDPRADPLCVLVRLAEVEPLACTFLESPPRRREGPPRAGLLVRLGRLANGQLPTGWK